MVNTNSCRTSCTSLSPHTNLSFQCMALSILKPVSHFQLSNTAKQALNKIKRELLFFLMHKIQRFRHFCPSSQGKAGPLTNQWYYSSWQLSTSRTISEHSFKVYRLTHRWTQVTGDPATCVKDLRLMQAKLLCVQPLQCVPVLSLSLPSLPFVSTEYCSGILVEFLYLG